MTNEQTALVLVQLRDELLATLDSIKERHPELQNEERTDLMGRKYLGWPAIEPLYDLAECMSERAFLLTGTKIP